MTRLELWKMNVGGLVALDDADCLLGRELWVHSSCLVVAVSSV
jgi:hypothetical protein